jgi:hypothetical protein
MVVAFLPSSRLAVELRAGAARYERLNGLQQGKTHHTMDYTLVNT